MNVDRVNGGGVNLDQDIIWVLGLWFGQVEDFVALGFSILFCGKRAHIDDCSQASEGKLGYKVKTMAEGSWRLLASYLCMN